MTTKDFSYKFCKDNQLLPEVRDNSIKIFHSEDCDIIAKVQDGNIKTKYRHGANINIILVT